MEQVTANNFDDFTKGKTVIIDFWAPWCGPCRAAAPIFEQAAGEAAGNIQFGKINVDENQELAGRFSVSTIPTFLKLEDGVEKDRLVGLPSKQKLESMWK